MSCWICYSRRLDAMEREHWRLKLNEYASKTPKGIEEKQEIDSQNPNEWSPSGECGNCGHLWFQWVRLWHTFHAPKAWRGIHTMSIPRIYFLSHGALVISQTWNWVCCVGFFGRYWFPSHNSGSAFRHKCGRVVWVLRLFLPEVGFNCFFKVSENRVIHSEFPVQISAHLPLHLIHLARGEYVLNNNMPWLVRICIIAHGFGRDHVCRKEQLMSRWCIRRREPCFKSFEED